MADPLGFLDDRPAALAAMFDIVLGALDATVWVLDTDLVILFSTGAIPQLDGRSHDELVGMPLTEYLGPELTRTRLPLFERVLEGEHVTYQTTREGHGEFEVHLCPVQGDDGEVRGVVGVMADVTDRNYAIRQSDSRFELVLRQLPAFLWTTDRELRVTEMLGTAARAEHLTQVGSTLYEFWNNVDEVGAIAVHERALAGESVSDETTYHDRTLHSELEPLRAPDGTIIGVLGVAFDVTEERRLQRELAQAQKMDAIGQLTGGIAHDFNNMLTVIAGYTAIARARAGDDEELQGALAAIDSAAGASASLTRQLLAFGRQQTFQPRTIDLNDTVQRMTSLLGRLLGEGIVLEEELSPQRPSVFADPGQVEQVVVNLALNARDAMPEGGTLRIATRVEEHETPLRTVAGELPPDRYAVLAVADRGIGMDEDTLQRAFEPFFSTKEQGKGTGLGLATVFGIVSQSGGGIAVASTPGAGTTFEIFLPAVAAEPVAVEPAPAASPPRQIRRVLLVDDDPSVRQIVKILLERMGFSVVATASADEARAAMDADVDAVVADAMLGGADGGELLAEIRRTAERPIALVLTSGWTRAEGSTARGVVFLHKPFDAEELRAALAAAAAAVA
jgi:PAS domain S-box-containing protein